MTPKVKLRRASEVVLRERLLSDLAKIEKSVRGKIATPYNVAVVSHAISLRVLLRSPE
jgi:broad specificity phosphatase PhoE